MIDKSKYKKDLGLAIEKLKELVEQRLSLDSEIARLRKDIGSLAQLAGETQMLASLPGVQPLMGLTAACLEALRAADDDEALNVSEVVESILRMGLQSSDNPNLLPSVHTTLKRMSDGDNPEVIECLKDGKAAYYLADRLTAEQAAKYKRKKGRKR